MQPRQTIGEDQVKHQADHFADARVTNDAAAAQPHRCCRVLWALLRRPLFRLTPPPLNPLRIWLLNRAGASVHYSSRIAPSVRIKHPWNLRIGPQVIIHHEVVLDCLGGITIGQRTRISQYAHLCARTREAGERAMPEIGLPITIGPDVWLAADCFVGPGVTVGHNAIIGARADVSEDVPPDVIAVGAPARPVKMRDGRPWPPPDDSFAGDADASGSGHAGPTP